MKLDSGFTSDGFTRQNRAFALYHPEFGYVHWVDLRTREVTWGPILPSKNYFWRGGRFLNDILGLNGPRRRILPEGTVAIVQ